MRVHEVMHHAVHVPSGISVAAAARLMNKEKVDSVLVDHEDIIAIFTEHDILKKVVAQGLDPAKTKVADIMSYPLHVIDSNGGVEEASDLMNKHHIRRLVVEEDHKIVGVINATCIARNIKYIAARRLMASRLGEPSWLYVE